MCIATMNKKNVISKLLTLENNISICKFKDTTVTILGVRYLNNFLLLLDTVHVFIY